MEDGTFCPFATVMSAPAAIFRSPRRLTFTKLKVALPEAARAVVTMVKTSTVAKTPEK